MPRAMPRPSHALAVVALAACQTATTPAPATITLRGDGDGVTLTRTTDGCRADDVAIAVGADGAVTAGRWRLAPGPAGLELRDGDRLVARIVDEPGPPPRRSYLDELGVPLARVTFTADAAAVTGPDRTAAGRLTRADGQLRWTDAAERATAAVLGTDDVEVGAALAIPPALPILGRAVVACARLAATSPQPAKSP